MQDRETEDARAAREYRERQERIAKINEETDRLMEDTRRQSRQSDIKFAIAMVLSVISIILKFILPAR